MRILAIETSSPPGSIALSVDGVVQVEKFVSARRTTQTFAVSIHQLLGAAQLQPSDIQVVATTSGPGSFTGIRISITAAKVFAHAVGARLVALNTLELLAHQVASTAAASPVGEIETVLDAQRGELFAAGFRATSDGLELTRPTKIIAAEEWIGTRAKGAVLTGTGLRKIHEQLPSNATVADEQLWEPSAEQLVQLAEGKLSTDDETKPLTLMPQYFRRSAAEEKADQSK